MIEIQFKMTIDTDEELWAIHEILETLNTEGASILLGRAIREVIKIDRNGKKRKTTSHKKHEEKTD